MRLFHNPNQHAYLRELSDEFGLAPSQVREGSCYRSNRELALYRHSNIQPSVFYKEVF